VLNRRGIVATAGQGRFDGILQFLRLPSLKDRDPMCPYYWLTLLGQFSGAGSSHTDEFLSLETQSVLRFVRRR
jgi:hypothetical protein